MAKINGKRLAIGVVMGVSCVLIAGGLFGLVKSAISGTGVESGAPQTVGSRTIEGTVASGVAVGTAIPDQPQNVSCDFNDWIGKSADEAEKAAKATGRAYRMLRPDSVKTMDFRADRINIDLDEKAVVTKVSCG